MMWVWTSTITTAGSDARTGLTPSHFGISRRSVIGIAPPIDWPIRRSPAAREQRQRLCRLDAEVALEQRDDRVHGLATGDDEVVVGHEDHPAVGRLEPRPADRRRPRTTSTRTA